MGIRNVQFLHAVESERGVGLVSAAEPYVRKLVFVDNDDWPKGAFVRTASINVRDRAMNIRELTARDAEILYVVGTEIVGFFVEG